MWPSGRHLYCGSRDLPNDFSFATFLAVFFIAYPSVSVLELKAQESCGPPVAGGGAVASVRDGPTADKCGWRQSKSWTAAASRAWSRSFVSVTVNSRSRKYWSSRARRGSQNDRRQGVRRYPVAFRTGCACRPTRSLGRPKFRPFAAGTSQPDCGRAGPICTGRGQVLSVRESDATIYLNFGRRLTRDSTVTILKRHRREFAAAGIDPQGVGGASNSRARLFGPVIDAVAPEQIERVE